jgi:hypothetical protein
MDDRTTTLALARAVMQSVERGEPMPHGLAYDRTPGAVRDDVESLIHRLSLELVRVAGERDELEARLVGAEAANAAVTETLVEHSELNGHIDIAEQCRDYLALLDAREFDTSGKLQDFVDSLRIVIDQLDRQRHSRNWYEVAYTAGKQKLIDHALGKICCAGEPHTCDQEAIAAAEGRADRLIERLAAVTAARDEACDLSERLAVRDPMDFTCVVCGQNMIGHPPTCRVLARIATLRGPK